MNKLTIFTSGLTATLVAGGLVLAQGAADAAKGKALFESSGCLNCHRINDKGSHTGPDLSDIGDRRTPERLQASILTPDAEVLPENRYVRVVLKDGTTVRGRLLNQDAFSIQLIDTKEQLRSLLKSNMKESEILDKGLMPATFATRLKADEVANIVAYLGSLKGTE
ncbi:MAG TPA: c-type cytochrome [Bryobacteraceae bacterium]|nr:c-type cytochrome [Bryobacteraceae bacterium]